MFEDGWQHQPKLYCCYCGKLGTTYRKWWDDIHCTDCDGDLPKEPDKPKSKTFLELTHPEKMVWAHKFAKDFLRDAEIAHYCLFNERTGEIMIEDKSDVG